jgi:hypothetical protein
MGCYSVVFGVIPARLFCFFYFGSGTCVVFYSDRGMKFLFSYFCEREGFFDDIPNGSSVGDGRWLFRSSVLWPPPVDLCSTPVLHKVVADGHSSSKLCLGDASGRQFLRLQQCVASGEKVGGGDGLVSSFFWRAGAPTMSLELLLEISKFVSVFFCKVRMYCAIF